MGPQYKYDITNDVIDDESRAELYSLCIYRMAEYEKASGIHMGLLWGDPYRYTQLKSMWDTCGVNHWGPCGVNHVGYPTWTHVWKPIWACLLTV